MEEQLDIIEAQPKILDWGIFHDHIRIWMGVALAAADMVSLALASWLGLFISYGFGKYPLPSFSTHMEVLFGLVFIKFLTGGLYDHSLGAVEELRRLSTSISIVFLGIAAISYWLNGIEALPMNTSLLAWVFSLIALPLGRDILRTQAIRWKMWGEPVLVFGNGLLGNEVAQYLSSNPRLGYKPVALVDRRKVNRGVNYSLPVIHDTEILYNETYKDIQTAILVVPETSSALQSNLVDKQAMHFQRIILISSGTKTSCMWVQPLDIGGILGLQVGQNLLSRVQVGFKRGFDLAMILVCSPILLPLFAVIAVLIRVDSNGSIFYHQMRIGRGGKPFRFWKFRSMYEGAEVMLDTYLEHNPEMRAEYEVTHKLKNDPRITHVGKFLRKFSLDELPQLINVLNNEMSLVGPRPFMENEIGFYENCLSLYNNVLPGITGMWQISGRSNVSYTTRVSLDEYYVRNWSVWLDLYIFIRTIGVVLRGRGSY
jgi:Undecaprenyl-phosphate galactose phosphotransferase WbaP